MGRPPTRSPDDFIAAAVRLFAAGGARAVTMTSVARAVGVQSGSVYHRFPDRPSLLAAVWLRTEQRFHRELLRVLGTDPDAGDVVAASGWTVQWCRDNFEEAVVLHAGARAFSPDTWPEGARDELKAHRAVRERELARVQRVLCAKTGRDADEIVLALLDLPIAVVNRYLARGEAPPASATGLVTRVTEQIVRG